MALVGNLNAGPISINDDVITMTYQKKASYYELGRECCAHADLDGLRIGSLKKLGTGGFWYCLGPLFSMSALCWNYRDLDDPRTACEIVSKEVKKSTQIHHLNGSQGRCEHVDILKSKLGYEGVFYTDSREVGWLCSGNNAIFSMALDKSLCLDGFNPAFFNFNIFGQK